MQTSHKNLVEIHMAAVKSLTLVEPQVYAIDRVSKSLRRPTTLPRYLSMYPGRAKPYNGYVD